MLIYKGAFEGCSNLVSAEFNPESTWDLEGPNQRTVNVSKYTPDRLAKLLTGQYSRNDWIRIQ